ncbi:MAG: M14 family zinc carboxypeptidase, partial [Planctomycetota bacterium]
MGGRLEVIPFIVRVKTFVRTGLMLRALTVPPALFALTIGWFWQTPPAHAERKRFDGHQVVKVRITDETELQSVYALEAASRDFDVWSDRIGIGAIDVRVSPEQILVLDASGLAYVVVVDDVHALVHYERSGGTGFFEDFRTYEEYLAFMNDLASTHPDLAEVVSLGTSLEGRDMWALHITGPGENKPAVLYHGCIHANEWFTSPIVAYTAEYLLTNYDTEPTVRTLVDNVEWFMMPILNVDGYIYTWTTDRWWRKNRRDNDDGTFGVDLNRNWGRGWGGPNTVGDPGSNVYRGPSPFSEPETRVVRDFLLANPNIRSYLDVHLFGGFLGWPWSYLTGDTSDEPTFSMVGETMAKHIRAVLGTEYGLGPMYEIMGGGTMGGLAIDWVYGNAHRWSYLAELYPWSWDFRPEEIIPACEEHFSAMLFLGAWTGACDPYGFRAGLAMAPDEFPDCNNNGRPDLCELTESSVGDCNHNWIPDECDLADGTSVDCDGDGLLDECGIDCNENAVADSCDIVDGTSEDCNTNDIPDECDFVAEECGLPV